MTVDGRPATREELARIAVIARANAALLAHVLEKVTQTAAAGQPGALDRIRAMSMEAVREHRQRSHRQPQIEGRIL